MEWSIELSIGLHYRIGPEIGLSPDPPHSISGITAETAAQALESGWISWIGVPSTVLTDCGRQLESVHWKQLMRFPGSKRIHMAAYHVSHCEWPR